MPPAFGGINRGNTQPKSIYKWLTTRISWNRKKGECLHSFVGWVGGSKQERRSTKISGPHPPSLWRRAWSGMATWKLKFLSDQLDTTVCERSSLNIAWFVRVILAQNTYVQTTTVLLTNTGLKVGPGWKRTVENKIWFAHKTK